jgi:6-phosphogluconolactonase (cycloisomerase 2 family)
MVSGLDSGSSGLVLQDNGGNNLTVTTNGTFPFTTKIASGAAYAVTVLNQPTTPAQLCTVAAPASGNATMNTTVAVNCVNVGKYVFVANPLDGAAGSVAAFTIVPTTGALNAVAAPYTPTLGTAPAGLALYPSGAYLYTANSGSANVETWGITAGALNELSVASTGSAPTPANNVPYSLAFDPAGFLYVGSNDNPSGTVEGFTVADTTGVLTVQPTSPYASGNVPYSLALDPTDSFLYAANVTDGTVSEYTLVNGVPSGLTYSNTLTNPYAIAVYPAGGFVYITDNTANVVQEYTYDATTGKLTAGTAPGDSLPTGMTPQGIAIDPTGSFLYVSNSGDGTVSAFTINASTGALTAVTGPFQSTLTHIPSATPTALAVDPSSQYLYVANGDDGTITVFAITATTGSLAQVGSKVPCTNGAGGPQAIVVQ